MNPEQIAAYYQRVTERALKRLESDLPRVLPTNALMPDKLASILEVLLEHYEATREQRCTCTPKIETIEDFRVRNMNMGKIVRQTRFSCPLHHPIKFADHTIGPLR